METTDRERAEFVRFGSAVIMRKTIRNILISRARDSRKCELHIDLLNGGWVNVANIDSGDVEACLHAAGMPSVAETKEGTRDG